MEIKIKPQMLKCQGWWGTKMNGVVLVKKQEDIEPLFKLLCEQDDTWKSYGHLIRVAQNEINSTADLDVMCAYCGKTDIYDVAELKSKIDFFLYQKGLICS